MGSCSSGVLPEGLWSWRAFLQQIDGPKAADNPAMTLPAGPVQSASGGSGDTAGSASIGVGPAFQPSLEPVVSVQPEAKVRPWGSGVSRQSR